MRHGLGGAELTDIGAAGKAGTRADHHDGRDLGIGIGAREPGHQGLPQFEPEAVDRRTVELEDGDAVRDRETQFVHAR